MVNQFDPDSCYQYRNYYKVLAILMQMNLQKGLYGDRRYFQEETLPFFAKMADNANAIVKMNFIV